MKEFAVVIWLNTAFKHFWQNELFYFCFKSHWRAEQSFSKYQRQKTYIPVFIRSVLDTGFKLCSQSLFLCVLRMGWFDMPGAAMPFAYSKSESLPAFKEGPAETMLQKTASEAGEFLFHSSHRWLGLINLTCQHQVPSVVHSPGVSQGSVKAAWSSGSWMQKTRKILDSVTPLQPCCLSCCMCIFFRERVSRANRHSWQRARSLLSTVLAAN